MYLVKEDRFENESQLFEHSPVPTVCINSSGGILHANYSAQALFSLDMTQLVNKPLTTSIMPVDRRRFNNYLAELEDGNSAHCELTFKMRFGGKLNTLFLGKPIIENGHFQFSIVSIIDISAQKLVENSLHETKEELQHLAHHDSLTNLPNRYLLEDRLETAMARIKRNGWMGALVFIDVDRFKIINDDYGHHVGDEVLIEVAKRLRLTVREQDTVCRYSGDEFIIILEDITCKADATNVIKKIIDGFSQPIHDLIEHPLIVSASAGACLFDKSDYDCDELIKKADYAMYESKKRGRNCYTFFSAEHSIAQNLNIIMENELSMAIEKNEFQLHFQPQIDATTNRIEGVEVLTRWMHPSRGIVGPDDFIQRMENAHLSSHLTEWVLSQACKVGKSLIDRGLEFGRIAVNITPKEFTSTSLIAVVEKSLVDSGLPANKLELELTESSIMQNPALAEKLLHQFNQMGIRLTLDDFGTGYSALSCLNDYPFHCIKIDKSFVDNLSDNKKSSTLVDAMMSIANSLGLDIIAEGVETKEQLTQLNKIGCNLMQGFYFSTPISEDELSEYLLKKQIGKSSQRSSVIPLH